MYYKFKPLDNIHLNIMIFSLLAFCPLNIGCLIAFFGNNDIIYFIISLILTLFPVILYVLTRLVYSTKYTIKDGFLIKSNKKRILFKIEMKNIKCILVKKSNVKDFFKFIWSLVIYDLSKTYASTLSFIFETCSILTNYNYGDFKRESLNNNFFQNCHEYVEIISYRKAKKVAKILNVPVKLIKK